ncbi:MAG: DEAD/DEAH box helicase [Gemmatimonadetes bacterium]|nr:DEAD/DEAH box helicase [Gemmatimonadota bacterium]
MPIPKKVAVTFSPPLRARGDAYVRGDQVLIDHADPAVVRATVQGAVPIRVEIRAIPGSRLEMHCGCSYAQEYGNCEHLWAALVTCDRAGVLPHTPDESYHAEARAAREAEEREAERRREIEREAAREAEEARMREAALRVPEPIDHPALRPPRPADPRPWVQQLRSLAPLMAPGTDAQKRETSAYPEGKRIIYIVDIPLTFERQEGLLVELGMQALQKNGEWGAPRQFRLTRSQWLSAPELVDREVAQMLLGAQPEFGHYAPGSSTRRFLLSAAAIETTLRRMCDSGRAYLRPTPRAEDLIPLTWDDNDPWELRLAVVPMAPPPEVAEGSVEATAEGEEEIGTARAAEHQAPSEPASEPASERDLVRDVAVARARGYRLEGHLARGEEIMPLGEPLLFMRESLLIARGQASRWIDHGAFDLVPALRGETKVEVPTPEAEELVAELHALPHLPPLELPPELQLSTHEGAPLPRLALRVVPRTPWSPAKFEGLLSFDYDGVVVAEDAASAALFQGEERRIVRRNRGAEETFARRLEKAGFRWEYDYGSARYTRRLSETRGEDIAFELTMEGWFVEFDGHLLRTAGDLSVSVTSGIDWFDLGASLDFGGGVSATLPELLAALRRGDRTVKLSDDSLGMLSGEWLEKSGFLAAAGTMVGGNLRFSAKQLGVLDVLLSALPPADTDSAFEHARQQLLRFEGVHPAEAPDGFVGTLRPYQKEGLGWLYFLRDFGFGGCLADDMGLGKTVQVLALLERRREEHGGTSIVVVPRSLVFNWEQEAKRFTPQLRILVHGGPDRKRSTAHLEEYDLVITTYGTLRRDVAMLREMEFDYAILDEAQAIKNAGTEGAKAARLIRARHRLAMTGTPIENRLAELWSLLEFLNPGMLGKASVFGSLIRRLDSPGNTEEREEARTLLARAVRPYILRRTKGQVAPELPERLEQTLVVDLSPKERALYNELRDHYRNSLLGRIDAQGMARSKMHVLEALLRLRQAACHPGLVDPSRRDDSSSKIDMLLTRVAEATAEDHKVLVFSQFTSLLAIVRAQMDAQGVRYAYLDGDTKDRQQVVTEFQEDPECKVFLVSLKAGGVGLNLTAAEYVYLLDPWWNPAVEAQAIDRAHRIGQTRRVFAQRLIARDTVEEKVLALQESKRDLADAIIRADNSVVASLGREELELLLS